MPMARSLVVAILMLLPLLLPTCFPIHTDNSGLAATDFGSFWAQQFHGVDLPPVLLERKSPLTVPQQEQFHQQAQDDSLFSDSADFCERANLFCNKSTLLIPAANRHGSGILYYGYGTLGGYTDTQAGDNRFFPFFQLRAGTQLMLPFMDDPVSKYAFLPRLLADKVSPLSKKNLSELKRQFHVSEGSNMSHMMDFMVDWCSKQQAGDEIAKCSTSLEDMVEFVVKMMGKNVECLSQPDVKRDEKVRMVKVNEAGLLHRYPILACHSLPFPVGVYYCHYLTHSRGFKVKVYSEIDGKETVRPVLCHFPKTEDNFRRLSQESATAAAAACHFLPGSHIAWVPN